MRQSPHSESEQWRIFAAIELPDKVQKQIQKQIKKLQSAVPGNKASWSRTENIHLTVKFFGSVEQKRIPRISDASARVVKKFSEIEIRIENTGAFPRLSQPRVLWIGVSDPSGELARLQEMFEVECALEGFEKETRDFKPHLTIARLRQPEGARALAASNQEMGFESMTVGVNELVVFRSEPTSKGSKYSVLSRHQIK
jgi:2'-5' RNA ligase